MSKRGINETPVRVFESIKEKMAKEGRTIHHMFYSDISWGGTTPYTITRLYDEKFRKKLKPMLDTLKGYTYNFAPPCPLDGWILTITEVRT